MERGMGRRGERGGWSGEGWKERERGGGGKEERELAVCIRIYSLYPINVSSCLQCDANPDATKLVVQEDKYENILTLITYYQMASLNNHFIVHIYTRVWPL